jgi:hypothetical protein
MRVPWPFAVLALLPALFGAPAGALTATLSQAQLLAAEEVTTQPAPTISRRATSSSQPPKAA